METFHKLFGRVDDPEALQQIADRLDAALIQRRLDYWIEWLGPRFSRQAHQGIWLRRQYSLQQVEYWHRMYSGLVPVLGSDPCACWAAPLRSRGEINGSRVESAGHFP